MRLGYRLHVSSGGLRDNHLLRCLTFGGNSEKDGQGEIPFRLPGLLSSRLFPFPFPFPFLFSWLASITSAYRGWTDLNNH